MLAALVSALHVLSPGIGLGAVFAPMVTFIRWRIALRRGGTLDTRHAALFVHTMARGLRLFA